MNSPVKAYIFTGINKSITFNLKLIAFDKRQLTNIWNGYNFIKDLCYPIILTQNIPFMFNNIVKLSIGDLYNNVLGYINSLSISYLDNTMVGWDVDVFDS